MGTHLTRHLVVAAVIALGLTAAPITTAGADAALVGALRPGESIHWPGEHVESGDIDREYTLETKDGGGRLRVALDVIQAPRANGAPHEDADRRRDFSLQVLDSSGAGNDALTVGTGYSTEVFVCFNGDPCLRSFEHGVPCDGEVPGAACAIVDDAGACDGALGVTCAIIGDCDQERCRQPYGRAVPGDSGGTWTIKVSARDVDSWTFRMRAKLERSPNPGDIAHSDDPLLPNLRARPPFELTLDCTPTIGYGAFVRRGTCGTAALGALGTVPPGCTPQELAETPGVEWCLRFSGGNENDGPGGLEILASNPSPGSDGHLHADAEQIIRRRDQTVAERRPAGSFVLDDSHGHWHYEGFMHYELFSVMSMPGERASLESVGSGIKRGWCPVDEFISDFERFDQAPRGSGPQTSLPACLLAAPDAAFGQSAGWGDIYEWARDEQFVPIEVDDDTGMPRAGSYVLRETIDVADVLLESDEDDNSAYAWFEVSADGVIEILERGYGTDPWDNRKTVSDVPS